MKTPIYLMQKGKTVRLDERSVIPQPSKPWYGFAIEFLSEKAAISVHSSIFNPHPLIWYCKSGHGQHKITSGSKSYSFEAFPHAVGLMQEKFEVTRKISEVTDGEYLALEIRPAELNQLFLGDARVFDFSANCVTTDHTLERLLSLMESEILTGCHSGRLYAESLSIAFIAYLTQNYAGQNPLKVIGNKLAEQSLKTILSYIQDHLATELSIVDLAGLLHMSPYHFARLFKASMGMAPHRYVMEQRILEAQRLLKSGISVTEAAHITGFASQSHLSGMFRRRFGVSPSSIRR
jgi:AraC family transcriptional regulator